MKCPSEKFRVDAREWRKVWGYSSAGRLPPVVWEIPWVPPPGQQELEGVVCLPALGRQRSRGMENLRLSSPT